MFEVVFGVGRQDRWRNGWRDRLADHVHSMSIVRK